ncbi:hypothetical protein D3C85_1825290 [compost metagenome]
MSQNKNIDIPEEIVEKVKRIVFAYSAENGFQGRELIKARTDRMLRVVQKSIDEIISDEEKKRDSK